MRRLLAGAVGVAVGWLVWVRWLGPVAADVRFVMGGGLGRLTVDDDAPLPEGGCAHSDKTLVSIIWDGGGAAKALNYWCDNCGVAVVEPAARQPVAQWLGPAQRLGQSDG